MSEQSAAPASTRHGDPDIHVRAILIAGIVFFVAAIVIHVGLWWMLRQMVAGARRDDAPRLNYAKEAAAPLISEPKLQDGVGTLTPADDMNRWDRAEADRLEEYAWVDRETGVVRIPVGVAMRIVASEGLPARADGPAGAEATPESVAGQGGEPR